MIDPNPKVSGMGIDILKAAGIKVNVGLLNNEARKLNEFYAKYITTHLPFVILKTAMTLDGKIATPQGESKWITSEKSRNYVHRIRGQVDAILSAVGTVKADNPRFTARLPGRKDPLRVIIDPRLEIPDHYHVLNCPPPKIKSNRSKDLMSRGIQIINYTGKLDLRELMFNMGKRGIASIMIEGGSTLAAHALNDGIVDRVMYFIAPKIIGGMNSYPAVGGTMSRNIEDAFVLRDVKVRRFAEDVLIEGSLG